MRAKPLARNDHSSPMPPPRYTESPGERADYAAIGRNVLGTQAEALRLAADRLNGEFDRAVELILSRGLKVIVTGLGKSGHVAHKLAATLCSTGTSAVFLHAVEATHGDLGVYGQGDPTILISKSGATIELVRLVPVLRSLGSPLIGILGNMNSPLAAQMDVVLDACVLQEADPHNLVPSCSTTLAMAIGDALAITLMHARRFGDREFARYHPSGQLGRNLWLSVADVMHEAGKTACVSPGESLRNVVIAMTRYPLGASCVVHPDGTLAGIITDGDLRRTLQQHDDIRQLCARDVMTEHPVTISPAASLKQAEQLMERRHSQISVLPVTDENARCLGLVRVHDLYRRGD